MRSNSSQSSPAPAPVVLIADDNHDLADALVELVELMGYEAVAVYDGQEAVRCCAALRPRLVILDINMPVLDGWQAANAIRSSGENIPCIAAHTALRPDCEPLKSGRDMFQHPLAKPMDFEQLNRLRGSTAIGVDYISDNKVVEGPIITFGRDDITLFQLAPDFDTFLTQVL